LVGDILGGADGTGCLERDFEAFPLHFENGNAVFLHEVDECANFFDVHGRGRFFTKPV
jgi:hypothetical protein